MELNHVALKSLNICVGAVAKAKRFETHQMAPSVRKRMIFVASRAILFPLNFLIIYTTDLQVNIIVLVFSTSLSLYYLYR